MDAGVSESKRSAAVRLCEKRPAHLIVASEDVDCSRPGRVTPKDLQGGIAAHRGIAGHAEADTAVVDDLTAAIVDLREERGGGKRAGGDVDVGIMPDTPAAVSKVV